MYIDMYVHNSLTVHIINISNPLKLEGAVTLLIGAFTSFIGVVTSFVEAVTLFIGGAP